MNFMETAKGDKIRNFRKRRLLFGNYCTANGIKKAVCPSCGLPTLNGRAAYGYCFLCQWEDDGQDDPDADTVFGGPNGEISLTDSRIRFEDKLTSYGIMPDKLYQPGAPNILVPLLLKLADEFKKDKPSGHEAYARYLGEFTNDALKSIYLALTTPQHIE
jgi:hypothetical protein